MNLETARQIVQGLAGALKGLRLYNAQHPALVRQVQALMTALLSHSGGRDPVRLGVVEGVLFLGDHLFPPDQQAPQDLAELFEKLALEGVVFEPGVTPQDLLGFASLLSRGDVAGDALVDAVAAQGIQHIRPQPLKPREEEPEGKPRQVYGRAIKVMETIFHDVRLGKIPSSEEAMKAVKAMAQLTIADPHALFALSMLKDYDNYTFTHSVNVSVIALTVGRACGLDEEQLRILGLGGLLHDLGKLKVDVAIITKPGRLTDAEFEEIKRHPLTGSDLAKEMEGVTPEVVDIVLGHHLRYDRTGYPADARGHLFGSMTDMAAIADTYDALTTLRSYQRPVTPRKAVERLREIAGSVLHPEFTQKFIDSLGTYPVGTLVRLDSNEIALVVRVGAKDPDAVELKILQDGDGQRLDPPGRLELSGAEAVRIVAEVDPFVKGIDVISYFE